MSALTNKFNGSVKIYNIEDEAYLNHQIPANLYFNAVNRVLIQDMYFTFKPFYSGLWCDLYVLQDITNTYLGRCSLAKPFFSLHPNIVIDPGDYIRGFFNAPIVTTDTHFIFGITYIESS